MIPSLDLPGLVGLNSGAFPTPRFGTCEPLRKQQSAIDANPSLALAG
jgi:hypothetical protein